jgi:hypothetical protein
MSPVTKANLLVMIVIAIIALGVSNFAVSATGSYVKEYINLNNVNLSDNTKMVPVRDDSFDPASVNKIKTAVIQNDTNITPTPPNPNGTGNNTTK